VKYGDILGRAFRALKSGTLWLYALTATLAVAAPFVLVGVAWFGAFRGSTLGLPISGAEGQILSAFAGVYVVLLVGGLLCIPIALMTRGGYVHLTNSILEGAPVSLADAWSFGARRIGRTFGIEAVLMLIAWGVLFVLLIPFALIIAIAASGANQSAGALIGGICLGYVYFFIVLIAFVLVWTGLEQVAIRYGLIGGRTFGDAISSAWQAFKAMKGRFVVFALIIIGLQYAYSLLTSFITTPLTFVMLPSSYWQSFANPSSTPDPTAVLGSMSQFFTRMALIYPILIALMVPFAIFVHAAWTAFFRQLTGLDVPSVPSAYTYGYPPAPTYPPAPPYPPTPQYAPTPGYGYPEPPQYPPVADEQAPPIAGYGPPNEGSSE
jgi:hypothetical protein